MKGNIVIVGILAAVLLGSPLHAQTFSSGSTGADGALNVTGATTLPLPESGVFNFTTVNIASGVTLRFLPNSRNTPVVILAQGAVVVAGTIDVSALGGNIPPNFTRVPGPGGFWGGFQGGNGLGPGGGIAGIANSPSSQSRWIGPLTLVPIVGGSGGAGCSSNYCGGDFAGPYTGGGGGGAVVIASSSSIAVSGNISANGGPYNSPYGGGGSGGAIRLVANAVSMVGGLTARSPYGAGNGVIRVEAPPGSLTFTGSSTPAAVLSQTNPNIVPTTLPSLTITSIAGFPVPLGAGARPDVVDLLLPTQLADPLPLVVQGSDIPVGTQVTLSINGSPGATATPGTLTGTDLSSTATLDISGLDRTKVIFLFASVTFTLPTLAQAGNPAGPDQIARLRVDAIPGNESTIAFLRNDGTEVALNLVPPAVRQLFGR